MPVNARVLTTFVMLLIFGGMSLMALQYPPKAQLMPLIVGVPATVMCLAQLLVDVRRARRERLAGAEAEEARAIRRREVAMFAWTGLFLVGILAFGFELAAPVLVFAFLWIGQKESLVTGLVGGVSVWLIMYGLFNRLLGLPLFEGLLTRALT
ncbi:MAG TPA: tripartite tricarboxylate transporter TctB family protein [Afifellaceae bacterium]|nr:tripartite tricarboxylate transporter TctB family protein [Afifellaceae bacterium]